MKGSNKMKRKIRNSVFETNSSSMHSLSYTKYKELEKHKLLPRLTKTQKEQDGELDR